MIRQFNRSRVLSLGRTSMLSAIHPIHPSTLFTSFRLLSTQTLPDLTTTPITIKKISKKPKSPTSEVIESLKISPVVPKAIDNFSFLYDNSTNINGSIYALGGEKMGRLSESSVLGRDGGTVVHISVNSVSQSDDENMNDFHPLSVEYRHRFYSEGLIPQNLRKRENHNDKEDILLSRIIDRSIRPLFPTGYFKETQVLATAHAADGIHDPIVLAVNSTSMALLNSNQPWNGPLGCVRVGLVDGKLVVNPTLEQLEVSDLNLLYAGTMNRVVMIETEAKQINEKLMKEALQLAQDSVQKICEEQIEFYLNNLSKKEKKSNKYNHKKSYIPVNVNLMNFLQENFEKEGIELYTSSTLDDNKDDRSEAEGRFLAKILTSLQDHKDFQMIPKAKLNFFIDQFISTIFRNVLLGNKSSIVRSDGRKVNNLRPIASEINVLPTVHGSAYFCRGDTNVLCTTTFGPLRDAMEVSPLNGRPKKTEYFYLHYDFPPYCTGETGQISINRRMIGHGNLAEKAIRQVFPSFEEFPYVTRLFSECTSSNGSSSMASVCGGALSLLDAGVPLKAPVAGISVGLITKPHLSFPIDFYKNYLIDDADMENITSSYIETKYKELKKLLKEPKILKSDYTLLKDILGSEDHHGDMDFKVAGSTEGITAIQLDVKLSGGIPLPILFEAIDLAREGRVEILENMKNTVERNTSTTSTTTYSDNKMKPTSPKAYIIPSNLEQINHIIKKNSLLLNFAREFFNVEVEVLKEKNSIYLYGTELTKLNDAKNMLEDLVTIVKPGDRKIATILDVKDYGIILKLNNSTLGLLHISEITNNKLNLNNYKELFPIGHKLEVEISSIDQNSGLIKLSRKNIIPIITDNETGEIIDEIKTILPNENERPITEAIEHVLPKFPTTPPIEWNPDYFSTSSASEEMIQDAIKNEKNVENSNLINEFNRRHKKLLRDLQNTNGDRYNRDKIERKYNHNNKNGNNFKKYNNRERDNEIDSKQPIEDVKTDGESSIDNTSKNNNKFNFRSNFKRSSKNTTNNSINENNSYNTTEN